MYQPMPLDKNELGLPLHDYQEYIRKFIITHPYCGIFLDCGGGKTLSTLTAIYELNPNGHVLVIAPKNIARSVWSDEITKWQFPIRMKSLIVDENDKELTRKQRLKRYNAVQTDPPTMYFINRELLTDLVKNMPVINGRKTWYFPNIIIDELQSFKSYNSARFEAMKYIRPCVNRLIGLTGTPTPNGLMDLWPEIYLMDQGQRLGPNITAYRETFFFPTTFVNNRPVNWELRPGAEDYIYNIIKDITVSISNPNIKLPERQDHKVYVYMEPKELKRYKEFMKSYVWDLENGEQVTAANAAVLQGKLSQMASGAIYTGEETNRKKEFEIIHKAKIEHCDYIVRNTNSPVLIAYIFQSDKDLLLEQFPTAEIFDGSINMKQRWNNQQIPIMLLQPASSCHGLNLQDGGHTLIWYSLPWSLEHFIQTNKRLHRQGQKNTVNVYYLLTHGTIDDKILSTLEKKDLSEQALMDAVKATLLTP